MSNRKNPTRGTASESRFSVMEFMAEFPDDDACIAHLWRTRYSPDGEHALCPKCGVERSFHKYLNGDGRQSWTCTHCGRHVHPTAGTIFHKSSTSLHLWYYALFLITSTRCGISAKQLERELGVTYKTAWRMFNVIRNSLMSQDNLTVVLGGKVEMDETYLTRQRRLSDGPGQHGRSLKARGHGCRGAPGTGRRQVRPRCHLIEASRLARVHLLPSSTIFTDEFRIYDNLEGLEVAAHYRVKHSAKVYVDGDVHTQTIEGFWSLVKGGLRGVYRSVSTKWLQSYLDEYAWRYNHREFTPRIRGVKRVPVGEAKFRLLLALAARPVR